MSSGSMSHLIGRFYDEVWNRGREQVAQEILAPSFRFRGSLGPEARGPDEFIGYTRSVHAAVAEFTCAVEELIVDGPRAAARMTFSGRHRGVLFGVAPTGRYLSWSGAAFFSSTDGRISELFVLGDVDDLKRQLGGSSIDPFAASAD